MAKIIEDAFEDDNSEAALVREIARLQQTVCYLLFCNEELRAKVRELERLRDASES